MKVSDTNCDYCHEKLSEWDYRYHGKHYCRKCYNYLFHFKICSVCNKRRKVYYSLKPPICKFCQVKNKPCIRCGKKEYSFGKITEHGPVCNSCAKYFTEQKTCSECKTKNLNVSNRKLPDGATKLLCQKCYNKKLPVCNSCGYRRKPYSYLLDNHKPICNICSIEVERECKQCHKPFPAGFGNICSNCITKNSIDKKTAFISSSLSEHMSKYFKEFSVWLHKRRGSSFTSNHIQHYHKYFFDIDELCSELGRLPIYEEVVDKFTVAQTRKYLSVTIFFDEKGLIKVDKGIQEEYANLGMIDKYLDTFKSYSYRHKLLHGYFEYLYNKYKNGKTTIRSIRLALTPAIKLLEYCDHFNTEKPDMNILSGYLWLYPGQKSSITGFINFLKNKFKYELSIMDAPKIVLKRPKTSKKILKQRLIDLLRTNQETKNSQDLIKTAIGYLHEIEIPSNVFINFSCIKTHTDKTVFIYLANYKFYLPSFIFEVSHHDLGPNIS